MLKRLVVLVLVVGAIAGCTLGGVQPVIVTKPTTAPKALIIGDIKITDQLWEPYRVHFVRGVEDWVKRNQAFELRQAGGDTAGSVVLLDGTITNFDKGNTALRWLVGMGAGKAKVEGEFELRDRLGATLARFKADQSYLGGAGIGGASFVDNEDLMRRFGETVAETIQKWGRGESLEK